MVERLSLLVAILGLYIIIGTIAAIISRRYGVRSSRDYYIAGGKIGTFLGAMTYAATTYSSFMIVGLVGISYFTGVGSLGFELAYYLATLSILAILAPVIYRKSKEKGWMTPSEMLGDIYGSKYLPITISVLYFFALLPYASAQLKGIGEAIAGISSGEYYKWGVMLGVVLVLVWTILAGIWSVAVTDALQGLIMIASAILLFLWLVWKLYIDIGFNTTEIVTKLNNEGLLDVSPDKGFWTLPVFASFTLPWLFFALTNPQVVQRLYMPKDEKSLKGMVIWFGVFGLFYTLIVVMIGLLARAGSDSLIGIQLKGKDSVTPFLIQIAPLWVSLFVFISIIAASISTVDSIILSVASSLGHDISKLKSFQKELMLTKTVIVFMTILIGAIAYSRISYIVALSVLSSVFLLPLLPATLIGLTLKELSHEKYAAWASILTGIVVAIVLTWYVGISGVFKTEVLGLTTPMWVFIASWIPWIPLLFYKR